ncbi:MAG TPA: CBS domain-containing protein [Candidatus Omnitrophota bacterium]|nr:CBS domain-containing protein [Candidatus Omnitrophota bacterium]HQL40768.1 CBS domain-containing protein [Candidatus Omnitrophota bacterium]
MLKIALKDVMCDHPIKVKESVSVGNVAHLLFRYQINGILVVSDKNPNKLIGIFTTTDLLRLMAESISKGIHRIDELQKVSQRPVGELASKKVFSLQQDDKVVKAIAIMHRKNVHTIPVYNGDKLVGVLGRHDVINIALS